MRRSSASEAGNTSSWSASPRGATRGLLANSYHGRKYPARHSRGARFFGMSDDRRLPVVHEAEDASPAATFASRLENALPAWTVETFAPSAAFERTGSSLIRGARARVESAEEDLCRLAKASAHSQLPDWGHAAADL